MATKIESIFKLDDPPLIVYNRKKEDFVKIPPTTGSAQNLNQNGTITFEINNQESFLYLPEAFIKCDFTITKGDGTALGNDNVTLEHNFFPHMFDQMILEVGSQQLEVIDNPGETDTLLKFVTTSNDYKTNNNSGWVPDVNNGSTTAAVALTEANILTSNQGYNLRKQMYNDSKVFSIIWFLSPLFGYLDYKKITYQLKFKIVLRRHINNEKIFYGVAATNGKLSIKDGGLNLWIPQIYPSLEVETFVSKRLESGKDIPVSFLKRITQNVTIPAGTGVFDWHLANISSNPRYLLVGFKSKNDTFQNNNSLFTFVGTAANTYISSVRVELNQSKFPIDKIQLDAPNKDVSELYNYYVQLCNTFGNSPQLNYFDFLTLYPIFVFDLTSQNEDLKKNGIQVKLSIERHGNMEALTAYCVMLEDTRHVIKILDGRMIRLE